MFGRNKKSFTAGNSFYECACFSWGGVNFVHSS